MLLCDIGNTSYHFLEVNSAYCKNKKNSNTSIIKEYKTEVSSFNPSSIQEKIFYICVNPHVKLILSKLDNWIDLSSHAEMFNYYETMGVDRIFACEAIEDGIILDAGSAITVDIVKNGLFEGGFIYPGLNAMSKTYKNISSALDYSFNFELDLDKMPKNSRDAISYGYLKTLYREVMAQDMKLYLTGGDAKKFASIFPHAEIDEILIFKGMIKIMKKADLC